MKSIELSDIATDFLVMFVAEHQDIFQVNGTNSPIFYMTRDEIRAKVATTLDNVLPDEA